MSLRRKSITASEILNLKVAVTTLEFSVAKFSQITELVFHLDFSAAQVDMDLFGEDAALTNGIQVLYAGNIDIGCPIKSTDLMGQYFDIVLLPTGTTAGAVNRHIYGRWPFWRHTAERGLIIDQQRKLEIKIQDDLSGSGNDEIEVTAHGWRK